MPRRAPLINPRLLRAPGCVAALAAAVLSSCATPKPGGERLNGLLVDPTQASLSELGLRLSHPRLAPIAIDFSRPLTPAELSVIAVVASPDLKALRAKAEVTNAQVFNAGLLPDPVITYSYAKRLGGPDPFDGMAGSVVYELVALRERRSVLAAQQGLAAQARLDVAWQELQTAGLARLLAERITGLSEAAGLTQRSRQTAEFALDKALQAQARGDVRADAVEGRRIASADAASLQRTTEAALDAARHDLNRLLGLSPQSRLVIARPPTRASDPGDPQALFEQARGQRLDLQALQAGYRSQSAVVRKAMIDAFPSLQLTLGRGEDTAHTQTFDPAVSLTLPLWNRNRGGIAIARATQAQLRAEYTARLFAARAEIAELVAQLRLEARQRVEIDRQLTPVRAIVDATTLAAARGDVARSSAEVAGQALADKALALLNLDQAMAEQRVTLALAVGGPLSP